MNPPRDDSGALAQGEENALRNLQLALTADKRFPDRLFKGNWTHFRFFNPDEIFIADFVDKLSGLLQVEGAAYGCIANLDVNFDNSKPQAFFFDRFTPSTEYLDRLKGDGPGTGWVYRMDRFGITSEIGSWLIYCEKVNEIAVIAFKSEVEPGQIDLIASQMEALPVEAAIARPVSFIFASRALPGEWSARLIEAYSSSR